jgi:MFS family permease
VRVLAISLCLFATAILIAAVSPWAWLFMAAIGAGGLAYGGINPPTNVVVAGRLGARLGFFMSLKQTGVPIGGFLAGIVLPPVALALSWRFAFGLAGLAGLAVAASTRLLRGAEVMRADRVPEPIQRNVRRGWIVLGLFGFVMAGIQWVFLTYLVLYLTEGRQFSLQAAGLVLATATASSVAGRLFWGWFSDRPGRRVHVLLATSAIAVATLALLAADVPTAALWPVAALTGAALLGWNGVFHAVVADHSSGHGIGRASGQVMAFVFAGSVFLPPLLGLASESLDSWRPLWGIGAAAVAVAGLVLWAGLRKQPTSASVSLPEAD